MQARCRGGAGGLEGGGGKSKSVCLPVLLLASTFLHLIWLKNTRHRLEMKKSYPREVDRAAWEGL